MRLGTVNAARGRTATLNGGLSLAACASLEWLSQLVVLVDLGLDVYSESGLQRYLQNLYGFVTPIILSRGFSPPLTSWAAWRSGRGCMITEAADGLQVLKGQRALPVMICRP